jgi:hypothetical protein
MLFTILLLVSGLTLSAVAIYYSVAGLVAIFAAAAIPIMIMGGALEVSKLVAASWLKANWHRIPLLMKTYMMIAVVVLMLITSMGIFGFLSKAHIEQTAASTESVAQVERLTAEIARQQEIVQRADEKIKQLQTSGVGADANTQAQIDAEQQRIDKAYERIQPAINEQQRIIDSQGKLFRDELAKIDASLSQLQSYIDAGDIRKAQAMVGAKVDGDFGPNTAAKFREWQTARQQDRAALLIKIEQATNNPQARAAANEIKRLRQTVETQIAESNRLINRLRQNIGKTDNSKNIDAQVDEQNSRITAANTQIDTLTQEKYKLESEYRKLEAEVGPIKYIAEFVYGTEADKNLLEKAVTWVIVVIIFVFDPLAVIMLLASQMSYGWVKQDRLKKDETESNDAEQQWKEYEVARAQAIVDNPGYTSEDPHPPGWMFTNEEKQNEDHRREDTKETEQADTGLPEAQLSEAIETQDEADQVVVVKEEDDEVIPGETEAEKLARREWKKANPESTIKSELSKLEAGLINKLPWVETTYIAKDASGNQIVGTRYVQNDEQKNSSALWKQIQEKKNGK